MAGFQDLLQFIFAGITNGAVYALIALGFCVVHNTLGIVNFVQVDFVSLGGMFLFTGLFGCGLPMWTALPMAAAGVACVGIGIERIGIRPSRSQHHLVLIFLTIGISIILRGVMKLVWGKNRMAVPHLIREEPLRIAGAAILPQTVAIFAITFTAILLLVLFFKKTRLGLSMRAVASNQTAASVVGIRVGRVKAASFAIAGGLGGLAGALVTPITTLSYDVGVLLGLKGFAAAIVGGFGSFPGAILGGMALGLMESLSAGYGSSAYKDVVAFVVLLLVLFVKPKGLLGQ